MGVGAAQHGARAWVDVHPGGMRVGKHHPPHGQGLVGATAHGVRGPVVIVQVVRVQRLHFLYGRVHQACGCGGQLLRGDGMVRSGGCVQQRGHAAGVPGLNHGVARRAHPAQLAHVGRGLRQQVLHAGQGCPTGQQQGAAVHGSGAQGRCTAVKQLPGVHRHQPAEHPGDGDRCEQQPCGVVPLHHAAGVGRA